MQTNAVESLNFTIYFAVVSEEVLPVIPLCTKGPTKQCDKRNITTNGPKTFNTLQKYFSELTFYYDFYFALFDVSFMSQGTLLWN